MAKIIYLGVFLTRESRDLLLSRIPPRHPQVHADHLTITFCPTDLEIQNLPVGHRVRMRILYEIYDELGQAVSVEGVLSSNLHPHITISCNREKGGTPNYSNTLLRSNTILAATDPSRVNFMVTRPQEIYLEGFIDGFPRNQLTAKTGEHQHG